MATNFRVKWAKSADSPSFVALAFLNKVEYHNSDFNRFICDDLTTSRKNLLLLLPFIRPLTKRNSIHVVGRPRLNNIR